MSDDRSMITQFEAAQVAKFDELYSETLKNSKIKIKNIKALSAMCARLIELTEEERILRPVYMALKDRAKEICRTQPLDGMQQLKEITGKRSYKRWDVIFQERFSLCCTVTNPFWTNFRANLFNTLASKKAPGMGVQSAAYTQAYNDLVHNWRATIVENKKTLIADIKLELTVKKQKAEERINPGNIKTLATEYHADTTPDNAAAYAKAIRDLQVVCTICLDDENFFKGKAVPQCHHVFHECCLWEWVQNSTTCPNCRTRMTDVFLY